VDVQARQHCAVYTYIALSQLYFKRFNKVQTSYYNPNWMPLLTNLAGLGANLEIDEQQLKGVIIYADISSVSTIQESVLDLSVVLMSSGSQQHKNCFLSIYENLSR
jgi:cell wall assembly regulator SMI1